MFQQRLGLLPSQTQLGSDSTSADCRVAEYETQNDALRHGVVNARIFEFQWLRGTNESVSVLSCRTIAASARIMVTRSKKSSNDSVEVADCELNDADKIQIYSLV